MNRRAGATDRHALLAGGAYPTSSSLSAYRSSSPYDSNPYPSTSSNGSSYPSSSSNPSDFIGAPKKEPPSTSSSFYSDGTFGRAASNYTATRTAEDLEEQNDQRLDGLTARVSMLKEITLNIGTEVTGSTKDLASLGEAFENTSAFLGGTFKRMKKMAKRQGGWFCNMMLFLLFVTWLFVFLWWWRR
ncbi:related to BET1-Type II membrane protein required for vesicular transport between ER and Golgi [Ustilago bromivora]|uniref:Related to BET1 - Type II membrane protein required for vesicular transport between ER and Golgi n=1 Tax=Ustilago bromivora TaxID=307758 RepID=A0A1K0G148_9BASI|nr:related to BET1-Type II membrane protein required for vesicular transport between ER and Golgi [Ustilago bromivora]SYW77836.1 related to BET1 - Type II membrane protein required for vesicular transport between ER and Golgi [Ustilago bromivora]